MNDFSFRTRSSNLDRMKEEIFDLLIIGGGITGAAAARDAVSRGLRVALVEKKDFAWGTSSRSSKLIHGGLRYLENLEFKLVFEALSERAKLLKNVPHFVRPLPFYMPNFKGESHGMGILTLGMWLYDLLALFRAPGFHKRLSPKQMREAIPFLNSQGLRGGFKYFDASMWDDGLVIEHVRNISTHGGAIANYLEALEPLWRGPHVCGFRVKDLDPYQSIGSFDLRAHRTIVCGGPWTDLIGHKLSSTWRAWLNPSQGTHLVFDLKRIPLPGALVMSHPEDGRISFVIPRPDLGSGVVIVGTTDGPVHGAPEKVAISHQEVEYLMRLLDRYFPSLKLTQKDILSAYVGIRPLMGQGSKAHASESLQKVSREHYIGMGPGGVTMVAGGKYTTHRTMAEEIVDFTLKKWKKDFKSNSLEVPTLPKAIRPSQTAIPLNDRTLPKHVTITRDQAKRESIEIPEDLWERYGGEAIDLLPHKEEGGVSPVGFSWIEAQFRFALEQTMVMRLEDFFLRRAPLFLSRADHGAPWIQKLSEIWAEVRGLDPSQAEKERIAIQEEFRRLDGWRKTV